MSGRKRTVVPSYLLHKASGNARVRISGRDIYLGKHDTPESKKKYEALVAEWMALGRPSDSRWLDRGMTCADLIAEYFERQVVPYYPKNTQASIRYALQNVLDLYAELPAHEFGPKRLKTIRERIIDGPGAYGETRCRSTVRDRISAIIACWRWGVAEEMLDPMVIYGLESLGPLKANRSKATEPRDVTPVPEEDIEAVLPLLTPTVADMVRVQLLTGMRPGELCRMTPGQIKDGFYWPTEHKTKHHGKTRRIVLGPRAMAILEKYLERRVPGLPVFSPAESHAEALERKRENRKTPDSCGNRPGTNRKAKPKRAPKSQWTVTAYARAVARACETVGVAKWSPNQLRHSAGAMIESEYGMEEVQAVLGHSKITTSQIYTSKLKKKAEKVMREVG